MLIEGVASTVRHLVAECTALHFGLSEASAGTIRQAHEVESFAAVQTE